MILFFVCLRKYENVTNMLIVVRLPPSHTTILHNIVIEYLLHIAGLYVTIINIYIIVSHLFSLYLDL